MTSVGQKIKVQAKALLFDMDGVLISSLGSVERSWATWARKYGLDVTETIRMAHGMRAVETVKKLRPQGDHTADLKHIEDLEVADTDDLKVLEGVQEILSALPSKYWTVVTSATERLARARLAHAGIAVPKTIVTGDMVVNGKPDPEPYVRGAEVLGVSPQDCVVLEDSSAGAKAGKAAGCRVLATTFSHSIQSLAAATWIVSSLAEVHVRLLGEEQGLELEFTPLPR